MKGKFQTGEHNALAPDRKEDFCLHFRFHLRLHLCFDRLGLDAFFVLDAFVALLGLSVEAAIIPNAAALVYLCVLTSQEYLLLFPATEKVES